MRILEITSDLDGGGVDRLLFDYCSRLTDEIQFDFVVVSGFEGILEKPLISKGCRIFHITPMRSDFIKHCREIYRVYRTTKYDIVHDHSGYKALFNLIIAKLCGVKCRIAHSHIAFIPETQKSKAIRQVITPLTKMVASDLFACGKDAAEWMWGKAVYPNRVYIMTNAIDAVSFTFSQKQRDYYRDMLQLKNRFVVGNVARFSYQKNHLFLLDVFHEIVRIKKNAMLVLVGRGELEPQVMTAVHNLGIENNVLFLGIRDDVSKLINCFDMFLLPSKYEGLPVTLVEVQANGLATVASATITSEIKKASNMKYIPLEVPAHKWAEDICHMNIKRNENVIKGTEYDIEVAAGKLLRKYKNCVTEHYLLNIE